MLSFASIAQYPVVQLRSVQYPAVRCLLDGLGCVVQSVIHSSLDAVDLLAHYSTAAFTATLSGAVLRA